MLPPPSTAPLAGLESILVAAALLAFGYLLVDALPTARGLDTIVRCGLATTGLVAYTFLLMLLHMATGGTVLRAGWLPQVLTFVLAALLLVLKVQRARRSPVVRGHPQRDLLVASVCVGLALLVWGTPVFRMLPLGWGGDIPWNMGFAGQLLNGETTPSARLTGDVPNYYPWLYHALTAFLAHFTPGGKAFHALGPLHVLLVAGSVLTLFALGRELTKSWVGGAGAALFAGMAGGFGFFMLRHLDIVINPRGQNALRYAGDLVHTRSYNVAFNNISPPFPRDVALAMLLAFLLLLVIGLSHRSTLIMMAGGLTLGFAGLAGAEAFLVGIGVAAVVAILPVGLSRFRTAAALFLPAVTVYAIWLVPLAVSYFRLGGFKNITWVSSVELTPVSILGAWGIATPLGAYGFVRALRRSRGDAGARVLAALLLVATFALLASIVVSKVLGEGFNTLGRRHRYWPLLHLSVSLFAAVGVTGLLGWVGTRGRIRALGLSAVVLGLALPSPLVASLALPSRSSPPPALQASLRGDSSTILSVLSSTVGRWCQAAVPKEELARLVFSYTGYRLLLPSRRVRWRDIFQYVPPPPERLMANEILTSGSATPGQWEALARTFDIDVIVGEPDAWSAQAFQAQRTIPGLLGDRVYVVAWMGRCDD